MPCQIFELEISRIKINLIFSRISFYSRILNSIWYDFLHLNYIKFSVMPLKLTSRSFLFQKKLKYFYLLFFISLPYYFYINHSILMDEVKANNWLKVDSWAYIYIYINYSCLYSEYINLQLLLNNGRNKITMRDPITKF